jgi:uncharacterized membrane protein YkoI
MKRRLILSVALIAALSAGVLAVTGTSKTRLAPKGAMTAAVQEEKGESSEEQARLAKQARITMEQARAIALKRAPGNVEGSELEKEHGKLVYSFDIRNAKGTITEVQVSALSGKIVRVEHENKNQEAEEKRQEEKEKSGNNRHP